MLCMEEQVRKQYKVAKYSEQGLSPTFFYILLSSIVILKTTCMIFDVPVLDFLFLFLIEFIYF